jgi:hypothetical protein
MNVFFGIGPGTGNTTVVTIRRTPVVGSIADVTNYTLSFTGAEFNKSFYSGSQTFSAGDRIHVFISYTGGSGNTTHDITVQLDCF